MSAAQPIKDQIKRELNVWDGTFLMPYTDIRYIEINSALVSAQNRERFYVHNCGEVELPKDRGIFLRDVLESGVTWKDKMNTIDANYAKGGNFSDMQRQSAKRFGVAEPVIFQLPHGYNEGGMKYGKSPTLTANACWQANNEVIEPIECKTVQQALPKLVDKYGYIPEKFNPYNTQEITEKSPTLSTGSMITSSCATLVTEPICLQEQVYGRKASADGFYDRRYEARGDGKTGSLTATMRQNAVAEPRIARYNYATEFDSDGKPTKAYCYADGKIHTVHEVKDGRITIKGKEYPIKLPDGFYIIRKLTVAECRRLQTVPDWYKMPCSDTQNYKMLGNGWTIEVIKHILSHIPAIRGGQQIEVLSMYDGMSCGRIALKELGANVVKYYATEIDKYAIQTTQANFPNAIQLGDAFQVRNEDWSL